MTFLYSLQITIKHLSIKYVHVNSKQIKKAIIWREMKQGLFNNVVEKVLRSLSRLQSIECYLVGDIKML